MRALIGLTITLIANVCFAEKSFNMPVGVTEVSEAVYKLHMTIFYICLAIGVVVFGIMFFAILFHRKSLGAKSANFHESTEIEIAWSLIPFLILVAMAVPATKTLLLMENVDDSEMTVKITGYTWLWEYEYLDHGIKFKSELSTPIEQISNREPKGEHYLREVNNELVLPIGKKIRLVTTSNDVQHSWWVPDLGFKKDAIPGFINETWTNIKKTGVYRGACAELCGINHGYMPIVVRAVTNEEFLEWVKKQKKG